MLKCYRFFFASGKPSSPIIDGRGVQLSGCDVSIKWSSPPDNGCPLTLYTVYYREVQSTSEDGYWHQINVTVNVTSVDLPSLKCNTEYAFKVSAWNDLGESEAADRLEKTVQMTNFIRRILTIAVPAGCGFLILITAGILCFRQRRKKRKLQGLRNRRLGVGLFLEIFKLTQSWCES